jgi:hypothetical protein
MTGGGSARIMAFGAVGNDLAHLLDRIRRVLDARTTDPGQPLLTEMEHTLTDGYARALALESAVWRIEKRMGDLAHEVAQPDEAEELRGLSASLRGTRRDLETLRGLLTDLHREVDAARATTPAS